MRYNKFKYMMRKQSKQPSIIDKKGNKIDVTFDNVQSLLDKGYDPYDLFEYVGDFYYGYAEVMLQDKWNLLSEYNGLVSPKRWFDRVDNFENGYAKAYTGSKIYVFDKFGNLYDGYSREPIDKPNTNTMTLNELKHIISESIKRALSNR